MLRVPGLALQDLYLAMRALTTVGAPVKVDPGFARVPGSTTLKSTVFTLIPRVSTFLARVLSLISRVLTLISGSTTLTSRVAILVKILLQLRWVLTLESGSS